MKSLKYKNKMLINFLNNLINYFKIIIKIIVWLNDKLLKKIYSFLRKYYFSIKINK